MAHPEGGRDPKDYPGNFDGGLGKMLAITGFTAEVSSLSEESIATRFKEELNIFLLGFVQFKGKVSSRKASSYTNQLVSVRTSVFFVQTAHAGANPYDGINALDAVVRPLFSFEYPTTSNPI